MTLVPLYEQIYRRYHLGPAVHTTHIENIDSIFREGALLAKNCERLRVAHDLSLENIQRVRAEKIVPCSGRSLHDYVPLYFGNRTPLVAMHRDKNEQLVFLRFSLDILSHGGVVISDGNARSDATTFRQYTHLDDLEILDPTAIKTTFYWNDDEIKRRKQAEVLVPENLSLDLLYEIICHSEAARDRIFAVGDSYGKRFRILVRPGKAWYIPPRSPPGAPAQ
jgi:hypothetical protein